MRRSLLASTALTTSTAFMAGAVWAADLPVKAPSAPPAKARFSWTGCYVGLNAGASFNHIDQNVEIPGVATFDSSGRNTSFTGGGQVGCNLQFDPNWVVGLEGDINYLNGKRGQNIAFRFLGEDTVGPQDTTLRWLTTVRGRFGYAWDRWFLYGTGGLAIGDVRSSVSATTTNPNNGSFQAQYAGSYSAARAGWTAGAGFEYAFAERLSLKLEYLHFDLGNADYLVNRVAGSSTDLPLTWNATAKVSGDIIRVGLNYRLTP
jgi:outer membrane immunogenic protein